MCNLCGEMNAVKCEDCHAVRISGRDVSRTVYCPSCGEKTEASIIGGNYVSSCAECEAQWTMTEDM